MRKRLTVKRKKVIRSESRLAAPAVQRRQERVRGQGDGRDGELRYSAGPSGFPRWETSQHAGNSSLRAGRIVGARGQADVASDFGDGERRRFAFYAERRFWDSQLGILANHIAYLLELIFS